MASRSAQATHRTAPSRARQYRLTAVPTAARPDVPITARPPPDRPTPCARIRSRSGPGLASGVSRSVEGGTRPLHVVGARSDQVWPQVFRDQGTRSVVGVRTWSSIALGRLPVKVFFLQL